MQQGVQGGGQNPSIGGGIMQGGGQQGQGQMAGHSGGPGGELKYICIYVFEGEGRFIFLLTLLFYEKAKTRISPWEVLVLVELVVWVCLAVFLAPVYLAVTPSSALHTTTSITYRACIRATRAIHIR